MSARQPTLYVPHDCRTPCTASSKTYWFNTSKFPKDYALDLMKIRVNWTLVRYCDKTSIALVLLRGYVDRMVLVLVLR
jgi:hypothetical protein